MTKAAAQKHSATQRRVLGDLLRRPLGLPAVFVGMLLLLAVPPTAMVFWGNGIGPLGSRHEVMRDVLQMLESGILREGDAISVLPRIPKPIAESARTTPDGRRLALVTYRYSSQEVILFSIDGDLAGAMLLDIQAPSQSRVFL